MGSNGEEHEYEKFKSTFAIPTLHWVALTSGGGGTTRHSRGDDDFDETTFVGAPA